MKRVAVDYLIKAKSVRKGATELGVHRQTRTNLMGRTRCAALPIHMNILIQRKIDFAALCLIYYEFRRKIPEIFSLLCWHRKRRDRDPVISARPRVAPISAVPVRFCMLNQKHFKT